MPGEIWYFWTKSTNTTSSNKITGVIGAKAPHILTPEEKIQSITINSMFIDIGASSKEEVENLGIRSGDPVVPYSQFEMCINSKSFMGKALDDRARYVMIIEIFRELDKYTHSGIVKMLLPLLLGYQSYLFTIIKLGK